MLLLGLDVGTSSIKASVIDSQTLQLLGSTNYPEKEAEISSPKPGWAEQSPEMWWENTRNAIRLLQSKSTVSLKEVEAIGISYQMHGLVLVNKEQKALRDAIIWCDSRAVTIGDNAFEAIGKQRCLTNLLNSPGNFTASKLAWVKENESAVYDQIDKIMLPGDFIAMKLTGEISTSISALSEGVFWDFKENRLSADIIDYFGFNDSAFPKAHEVFSSHGQVSKSIANELGLKEGIPVSYKAGDQPNNALSLNVLEPGEVAATAGTSGVIYGVSDQLIADKESRVNTFAHVNHTSNKNRLGVLLCINGTGILNRWAKNLYNTDISYPTMNELASSVPIGSEGVRVLPFGNGAERMLNNKNIGAHFQHIDFNRHQQPHLFRAVQEGIAFSFRYGLEILRENGVDPQVIRAGKANMFLSDVFIHAFVNTTGVPVELYQNDGSVGAAIGAGIGAGYFNSPAEAFKGFKPLKTIEPEKKSAYEEAYLDWKSLLLRKLN